MKKTSGRRLKLSVETLRSLSPRTMGRVAGGASEYCTLLCTQYNTCAPTCDDATCGFTCGLTQVRCVMSGQMTCGAC